MALAEVIELEEKHGWDPPAVEPNDMLKVKIISCVNAKLSSLRYQEVPEKVISRSELDSHANMIVLGKECEILSCSDYNATVSGW